MSSQTRTVVFELLQGGSAITILLFNASVGGSGTYLATQLEPNRAVAGSPAALRQLRGVLRAR